MRGGRIIGDMTKDEIKQIADTLPGEVVEHIIHEDRVRNAKKGAQKTNEKRIGNKLWAHKMHEAKMKKRVKA